MRVLFGKRLRRRRKEMIFYFKRKFIYYLLLILSKKKNSIVNFRRLNFIILSPLPFLPLKKMAFKYFYFFLHNFFKVSHAHLKKFSLSLFSPFIFLLFFVVVIKRKFILLLLSSSPLLYVLRDGLI